MSMKDEPFLYLRYKGCLRAREALEPSIVGPELANPLREAGKRYPSCLCPHHRSTEKSKLSLIEARRKELTGPWFKLSMKGPITGVTEAWVTDTHKVHT